MLLYFPPTPTPASWFGHMPHLHLDTSPCDKGMDQFVTLGQRVSSAMRKMDIWSYVKGMGKGASYSSDMVFLVANKHFMFSTWKGRIPFHWSLKKKKKKPYYTNVKNKKVSLTPLSPHRFAKWYRENSNVFSFQTWKSVRILNLHLETPALLSFPEPSKTYSKSSQHFRIIIL